MTNTGAAMQARPMTIKVARAISGPVFASNILRFRVRLNFGDARRVHRSCWFSAQPIKSYNCRINLVFFVLLDCVRDFFQRLSNVAKSRNTKTNFELKLRREKLLSSSLLGRLFDVFKMVLHAFQNQNPPRRLIGVESA